MKQFHCSWRRCSLHALLTIQPALPIRATRTGRACRPRFPSCRWSRCGRGRRSMTRPKRGRTISKIKDLVPRLAARRVPLDDAEKSVAEFVTGSAAEREQKAKLLFAGLFDRLNRERTEVMNGIERLNRRQQELADKLRSDIAELHKVQDAPTRMPPGLRRCRSRSNGARVSSRTDASRSASSARCRC